MRFCPALIDIPAPGGNMNSIDRDASNELQSDLGGPGGGRFYCICSGVAGRVFQGETSDEALTNIREAIELYLESIESRGISLPKVSK